MDHGIKYGKKLGYLIDAAFANEEADDEYRTHLGASVLGEKCARAVWFRWKWAAFEAFDGRMLRLFARGHREEEVFTGLLRRLGCQVWTGDENGNQFRVSFHGGHVGGATDGVILGLPELPDVPCLLEMKTHNDKRFKEVRDKGVRVGQPKHYHQGQVYAHGLKLPWVLYCAVNKNDDELFFELFQHDVQVAEGLLARAGDIVFREEAPPRISENSSWWECRFCPARGVCFGFEDPKVNCRTCRHSKPLRDGTWSCSQGRPEITERSQVGCEQWSVDSNLLVGWKR